jgi:hypothetical protein
MAITFDLAKTDAYLDALRPIVKELENGYPGSRLSQVRNQLGMAVDLIEQEQRELLFAAHTKQRKS